MYNFNWIVYLQDQYEIVINSNLKKTNAETIGYKNISSYSLINSWESVIWVDFSINIQNLDAVGIIFVDLL